MLFDWNLFKEKNQKQEHLEIGGPRSFHQFQCGSTNIILIGELHKKINAELSKSCNENFKALDFIEIIENSLNSVESFEKNYSKKSMILGGFIARCYIGLYEAYEQKTLIAVAGDAHIKELSDVFQDLFKEVISESIEKNQKILSPELIKQFLEGNYENATKKSGCFIM